MKEILSRNRMYLPLLFLLNRNRKQCTSEIIRKVQEAVS